MIVKESFQRRELEQQERLQNLENSLRESDKKEAKIMWRTSEQRH
jgi:hypothetical protein